MKKTIAVGALLLMLAGLTPTPAHAGGATNAALGLASFAVFNQLVGGIFAPRAWAAPYYPGYYYGGYYPPVTYAAPAVTYYAPPAYYAQPPVAAYAPPPPRVQNEVVYPHGRYMLTGDGVTTAYQWVWIPNPPPPPAAPPPPQQSPTR